MSAKNVWNFVILFGLNLYCNIHNHNIFEKLLENFKYVDRKQKCLGYTNLKMIFEIYFPENIFSNFKTGNVKMNNHSHSFQIAG